MGQLKFTAPSLLALVLTINAWGASTPALQNSDSNLHQDLTYDSLIPLLTSPLSSQISNYQKLQNSFNDYIQKNDRKHYFKNTLTATEDYSVLPNIFEQDQNIQENNHHTRKILNKYFGTLIADRVNEKYKIFSRQWRWNKKNRKEDHQSAAPDENDSNPSNEALDMLNFEVGYRVRSNRMTLLCNGPLFDLKGTLYYGGKQEVELSREIPLLGVHALYSWKPSDPGPESQKLTFEKSLTQFLRAKATFGSEKIANTNSFDSSQIFEFLYNTQF